MALAIAGIVDPPRGIKMAGAPLVTAFVLFLLLNIYVALARRDAETFDESLFGLRIRTKTLARALLRYRRFRPRRRTITYKASGWIHVGATQGRGRYDTRKEFGKPIKAIWLCPFRKDWKRALNQ